MVLAVKHLQDPGFVHLQAHRLQLKPLLELGDSLQFPILFVKQTAELLLVLAGFGQIVFII